MIITDASSSKAKSWRQSLIIGTGLVALLLLFLGLRSLYPEKLPAYSTPEFEEYEILCDAEKLKDGQFLTGDYLFANGNTQSDEAALSGQYSCKVPEGNGLQFGITYQLEAFQPGDLFKVSVWRLRPQGGNGLLVVAGTEGSKFYLERNYPIQKNQDGWEKIEYFFNAPEDSRELRIYVYTNGNAPVYFDDLRIERIIQDNIYQPEVLNLHLRDKHLLRIENKRTEAIKAGLLETAEDDWVKAKLLSSKNEEELPVELRLKGDWLDHLKGEKWSFRIKVKDPFAWNRLKSFSVQTPAARDFLSEWLLHKLWEKEDVLTPRYDFIKLQLNGKPLGIYVYEEHFDKQLPEFKQRREGVIIRLAEDGFWASIKRQLEHVESTVNYDIPQPEKLKENAVIRPFKESQSLKNPILTQQFEVAQTLLHQYVFQQKSPEEIFDLNRMAKYFAICDVMGAYHGLIWHNQRFYYNPVTSKLEPVGFDGFPEEQRFKSSFIGNGSLNKNFKNDRFLFDQLFRNRDFFVQYIRYLYQYTSRPYLESFLNDIRPELEKRLNLVKMEFPAYDFTEANFIKRAQRVHLQLLPLNEASLRAFRQNPVETKGWLKVSNLHGLPLEIIGTGLGNNEVENPLTEPVILAGFQNDYLDSRYEDLELNYPANFLYFRVLGLDSVFHTPIINWKLPAAIAPAQELFGSSTLSKQSFYQLGEKSVHFPAGKHQTDENIIIPEGYSVSFEAGCELDLIKAASFISKSPVRMLGNPEQSIRIFSSDRSAGGFTVMQAAEKSVLNYVVFENLNTLQHKNWQLTGAVTFYESNVDIQNSIFRSNLCEDALNLIRCQFQLDRILIRDTPFDGLDVDFGQGKIKNSQFINTANDGVDLSGSFIQIENCLMDNCQDKGISVGEETVAYVHSATIKNSNIGVASKDLSRLTIQHISLENCQLGFTAYQKKPEFGGSKIIARNYTADRVKRLYNIPVNNSLILRGQTIEGR